MPSFIRRGAMTAAGVAAAVTAALAIAPGGAVAADGPTVPPRVEVEIPGPERGTAAGSGHTLVPADGRDRPAPRLSAAETAADGRVTRLAGTGSTDDRLDIVVLGDGYTAAELPRFHEDARKIWEQTAAVEPYTTYRGLFNVWAVDAVSNESGVTGDPDRATVRDTAIGSYFWCADIERLLCVDQTKVDRYAAKAPEADLVVVLANSAKYGGAGYNEPSQSLGYEGIATASAGNPRSGLVAIHETGHSLGKLADEYFYPGYPGYEQYTGPEPGDVNISTLGTDAIAAQRVKWHRWLGEPSPDGGTVGAYEGGGYFVKGLNRPTGNSMMRSVDKPFNLPGTEAMIAGFYRHAEPVTAVTPTDRVLRLRHTAEAAPVELAPADGRQLTVRWYLDGKELRRFAGRDQVRIASLMPRLLDLRAHRLTVSVEDRTPSVRDPKIAATMKASVTWTVRL
ncbi:M64 family metallopeptidase [Streptomyces sp. NPDC006798]|uniref:M64 family metallopeptidase n=1 Tax=Streptomyces sp. NPDC006798 TaxID=3155462 RepID=UPI00340D841A